MALEVTNKDSGLDGLELLKKLQSIDNKIQELDKQKKTKLKHLEKEKSQLEDTKALLAEKHEESTNFQKEIDSKYLDLKCIEEEIKKFRSQLFQIKNNREYSALLSEIGGKEADKSVMEDKILSMMSELEGISSKEEDLAKEVEKQEKELAELQVTVEGELAAIDRDIEATQALWRETAQQVNKSSLDQYKRLIEKDGQAVVEVSGEACGGCFMHITPQTLNLLLRRQELILCQNCGKILYL
ncbi:MAG: zinc ribbon domain-containing protein [Candidatus Brocadiales bacterium]